MDPYRNPFAPGAGSRPPELAGRDQVLESARIACGRAISGRSARINDAAWLARNRENSSSQ